MDNIIKVRRSFLNELRGFCNRFASLCNGCYRSPCNCGLADEIHIAKSLIFRIDNIRDAEEERFYIANPQLEKRDRVIKALRQAGRPVLANEIKIEDKGDGKYKRQKKFQLLTAMLHRGDIELLVQNHRRFYALPTTEVNPKHKQQNKENDNGIQS